MYIIMYRIVVILMILGTIQSIRPATYYRIDLTSTPDEHTHYQADLPDCG
jgi:hypothetical protein